MKNTTETSKLIAYLLRHHPEELGLELDEHGWANVQELIKAVNKKTFLDMALLDEIVTTDSKGRYSFNEDKSLIRANQGHSIPVDVELQQTEPPDTLFHGSGEKYMASIGTHGLLPKSRLYVHLSNDIETAIQVGLRHGTPIVYSVDSGQMSKDGHRFFLSANGVWLTKSVPAQYLTLVKQENNTNKEAKE